MSPADVYAYAFRALEASASGETYGEGLRLVRGLLAELDEVGARRVATCLALLPKWILSTSVAQSAGDVEALAVEAAWLWSQ